MTAWPRFLVLATLGWLLMPGLCPAQAVPGDNREIAAWSTAAEQRLQQLSAVLKSWQQAPTDHDALADEQRAVLEIRDRAEKCIADFSAQLSAIQERIKAIGEPDADAAADIRVAQKEFQARQQAIEGQLAVCRLIALGARDLRDAIAVERRKILSRELLHRERNVWQIFTNIVVNGLSWESARSLEFEPWPALGAGVLLLALLTPIALFLRQALHERFAIPAPEDMVAPRRAMLAEMYGRRAPWLAVLLAAVITLFVGRTAPLAAIGAALLISTTLAPFAQLLVCQGKLRCPEGLPARLSIELVLVAGALMLVDVKRYLPEDAFLVLRALFFFSLVLVAFWLLYKLTRREDLLTLRSLRLPTGVALLAGPMADWLGYHNLGEFLTLGVYGSAAGAMLTWLLLSSVGQLFAALNASEDETQSALRQWLGYQRGERVPGIGVMRWLITIGGLLALGYWLLYAWQVSESDTAFARQLVNEGFNIGAVRIVPSKLVAALLAFLILLALARWLRRQLGERWLTHTSLDAGARQSVVSLTSYTIIGVAIMLALSMAGLDLQNLAIVAGALSVGIGFGLQNIVNNFVSGLILLFERPVRPGDWVIVGATEGYVRRISIRYTLIQTFDRAEVLVPNSELISNQVVNLMLSDSFGRVIIPVGVAYGSDTRKVRDILHKVASEHPMSVLHDPRVTPPRVFFMAFGDSSLNFELRFFIRNIDYKLSVRSDILFAIDDAFREAGIEIPFPQRVVHMPSDAREQDEAGTRGDPEQ